MSRASQGTDGCPGHLAKEPSCVFTDSWAGCLVRHWQASHWHIKVTLWKWDIYIKTTSTPNKPPVAHVNSHQKNHNMRENKPVSRLRKSVKGGNRRVCSGANGYPVDHVWSHTMTHGKPGMILHKDCRYGLHCPQKMLKAREITLPTRSWPRLYSLPRYGPESWPTGSNWVSSTLCLITDQVWPTLHICGPTWGTGQGSLYSLSSPSCRTN
jgi:hypothetical protein